MVKYLPNRALRLAVRASLGPTWCAIAGRSAKREWIGGDATTHNSNAAMKPIVRRDGDGTVERLSNEAGEGGPVSRIRLPRLANHER